MPSPFRHPASIPRTPQCFAPHQALEASEALAKVAEQSKANVVTRDGPSARG